MKKTLFRLTLVTLLAFLLCLVFVIGTSQAHADEPTDTVTETETMETGKTAEDVIAEITTEINKLKSDEDKNFFNETILPLLTGAGSGLLVSFGALVPYIKKNRAYAKLWNICTALESRNEELQKICSSTDPEEIKKAIVSLFGEEFMQKVNEIYDKMKDKTGEYNEIKIEIATLSSQVKALLNAAAIAWNSKSQAVAALTAAPEKTVLLKLENENESLKNYVREVKGDEAEEIIKDIEQEN